MKFLEDVVDWYQKRKVKKLEVSIGITYARMYEMSDEAQYHAEFAQLQHKLERYKKLTGRPYNIPHGRYV